MSLIKSEIFQILAGMALDPGIVLKSMQFGAVNFHFAGALGLNKYEFLQILAANIFLRPGPVRKIFFMLEILMWLVPWSRKNLNFSRFWLDMLFCSWT